MTGTLERRPGGEVVVYEAPNGGVALDVSLERETVWLSRLILNLLEEPEA